MSVRPESAASNLSELEVVNQAEHWLDEQDSKEHNANDRMVPSDQIDLFGCLLRHPYTQPEGCNVHEKCKDLEEAVDEP